MLGTLYEYGWGVAANGKEALRWYRRAAEQGEVEAQANLGSLLLAGTIVAPDYAQAHKWLRTAADQGDVKAQLNLARSYRHGLESTRTIQRPSLGTAWPPTRVTRSPK